MTKNDNNMNNGEKILLKQCRKCGDEKPITEFGAHQTTPDRLKTWCVLCYKMYNAERYQRCKDKMTAQTRAWQAANPKKVKEYQANWRDKE